MPNFAISIQSKESLITNLNEHALKSLNLRFIIFDWELSDCSHLLVKKNNDKYTLSYTLPFFLNIFNRFIKKTLFNFKLEIKIINDGTATKALGKIKLKKYVLIFIVLASLFSIFQILVPFIFTKPHYAEINWKAIVELSIAIFIILILLVREYFLFKKRMELLLEDIEKHIK